MPRFRVRWEETRLMTAVVEAECADAVTPELFRGWGDERWFLEKPDELDRDCEILTVEEETGELVVPLCNGLTIRSGGDKHEAGAYVRICDEDKEIHYWDKQEWQDAPEEVMGAILMAAKRLGGNSEG